MALATIFLILVAAHAIEGQANASAFSGKLCYFFHGEPSDLGWVFEHDNARISTERRFGLVSEIFFNAFKETAKETIRKAIAEKGCRLVLCASFDYNEITRQLAEEYPDIKFVCVAGTYNNGKNLINVFGRIEQPRYLSGVIAGMMTKTKTLGYVAAFRNAQVLRGINAVLLGARAIDPSIKLKAWFVGNWLNTRADEGATTDLIDNHGADFILYHVNIPNPCRVANKKKTHCVGYHSDIGGHLTANVLTSVRWNFSYIYEQITTQLVGGNWSNQNMWPGMETSTCGLAPFSPLVPQEVAAGVANFTAKILQKDDIFCGPRVARVPPRGADGCLTDDQLLTMNYFLENAEDLGDWRWTIELKPSEGGLVAITVLTAISVAVVFVFLAAILSKFQDQYIKAISVPYSSMCLLGAMVALATNFLLLRIPDRAACNAAVWTFSIGYSTMLGSLILKIWRIAYIFRSVASYRKSSIKDIHLLPASVFIMAVDLAILIPWTAAEPLDAVEQYQTTTETFPYEYYVVCSVGDGSKRYLYAMIAWKLLLLIFAAIIAVQSASIRVSRFNESRALSTSVYIIALCFTVCLPISLTLATYWSNIYLITSALTLSVLFSSIALFSKKFYYIAQGKESGGEQGTATYLSAKPPVENGAQ